MSLFLERYLFLHIKYQPSTFIYFEESNSALEEQLGATDLMVQRRPLPEVFLSFTLPRNYLFNKSEL